MNVQLVFTKTSMGKGTRMVGVLKWLNEEYSIVSGGYGKGSIPDGQYDVEVNRAVEGDKTTMKSGFVNSLSGRGWFLPLKPKFSTQRYGFGIHPDGNLPGTKGCVGLQGDDIKKFWDKWLRTPMKLRPKSLTVKTKLNVKS